MDSGLTSSRFNTTNWTLIAGASGNRDDLEELLRRYWSPVYAWLRRQGHQEADAADLTQGFLGKIVEDHKLIDGADQTRGRFRAYLLTALRRFVIDRNRTQGGRPDSSRPSFIPTDPDLLKQASPSEIDDPDQAFNRQWATAVLEETVRRVKEDCQSKGQNRQWQAFDERVLRQIVYGNNSTPINSMIETLNAHDRQDVYSMIHTIKRKLIRTMREVVAETVKQPEDIETELKNLRQFLNQ